MATKNEWQEYFELMNDRKPTEEEVNAALAAGEIDAEVVVEEVVTPVQPTQPVAASVQTTDYKKSSVDTEEIKKQLSGFWGWTKDAVKNPALADGQEAPKFYGLISLALSSVIFAASITGLIYLLLKGSIFQKILGELGIGGQNVIAMWTEVTKFTTIMPSVGNVATRVFMYMLVLGALMYASIVLATFVARRYVLQDASFDFMRAVDVIGRGVVFAQLAWVLIFLEGYLNLLGHHAYILIFVLIAAFLFGAFYALFTAVNHSTLNNFYAVLAATTAMIAIVVTIMAIGGNAWGHNLFDSFTAWGKELDAKMMNARMSGRMF